MKEERLRYLAEIGRQRSISAAAKNLYLSQASLSSTLRETEKELGFTVFERTTVGVVPTNEGEEALRLVDEINECIDQIRALGKKDPQDARRVSLIVSPSIAHGLLLPLLDLYRSKQPDGLLIFRILSGESVVPSIIKNEYNVGLTYMQEDEFEETSRLCNRYRIHTKLLMRDRLYFIMRKDSPMAQEDSAAINKQKGIHFALLPYFKSSEDATFYAGFMSSANAYTVFPSVGHQKNVVKQDNMVAIMPGFSLHYELFSDKDLFISRPVFGQSPRGEIHLCLIHRQENELSDQERCLIECIQEHFQQLNKETK